MIERAFSFFAKYPLDALGHAALIGPILMGLLFYRHLQRSEKTLLCYFFLLFLKETYALVIILNNHSNLYMINVQAIIDILFFGLTYHFAVHQKSYKNWIVWTGAFCLLLNLIYYESSVISPVNQITSRLYAIFLVLLYFNDLLIQLKVTRLYLYPMFWLTSGILIHATGTFLIALFGQILVSSTTPDSTFELFYNIQQVIFILFCFLSSVAFWMSRYQKLNSLI